MLILASKHLLVLVIGSHEHLPASDELHPCNQTCWKQGNAPFVCTVLRHVLWQMAEQLDETMSNFRTSHNAATTMEQKDLAAEKVYKRFKVRWACFAAHSPAHTHSQAHTEDLVCANRSAWPCWGWRAPQLAPWAPPTPPL